MSKPKYDFSGWATRTNLKCSDGRTILKDAFKRNDGQTVPLVWNHQHNDPNNVLGHALLQNRDEGVYAYCFLNDTDMGRTAKGIVQHGDVTALSIYANQLEQRGGDVLHGQIREVSLVLAGANPGAYIESVIQHGEESDEEAVIYSGEGITLIHADEDEEEEKMDEKKNDNRTVGDVFDTFTEEQKKVVYALIGQALEDGGGDDDYDYDEDDEDDEDEGGKEVKHNVFDRETNGGAYLSHADMQQIFADGKRCGSLREAVRDHMENGVLAHSIDATGMTTATGTQTYGFNDPSMLFPDYKSLNTPPEWISRDMGWVKKVLGSVHHTPFSRIKSMFANITEDEARAKGYIKGGLKKEEVFTTLKRTTDPQTVYKKQKLDRDDIIDITDFDVVAWIRAEMRLMLDEELARAILIGDGRLSSDDDKIQEIHIRPIVSDVPLFNIKHGVSVAANADSGVIAKATVNESIRARKAYKGSGNPTFFTTEDVLTEMLLLEDGIGHKLYKTEQELATALRVRDIVTVEVMEDQTVSVGSGAQAADKPLIGVIVNLADYNVGADKGGEVNMFDDFDIDYNQQKYLIETRCSGALVKPFSAITLYLDRAA